MTLIATGFQAQFGYAEEATYGVAVASALWIGQVQTLTETLNQNAIDIWRMDGTARFPQYILQGKRAPSLSLVYFPQDIGLLSGLVNSSGSPNAVSNSYDLYVYNNDTSTGLSYVGLKADKVSLAATLGEALKATVSLQGSNSSGMLPSGLTGAGFGSDPGGLYGATSGYTPFYFISASFASTAFSGYRILDFSVDVANTLIRVYEFGQAFVRAIPTATGEVTGQMKVTFEDLTDYNNVMSLTPADLTFNLGSTNGTPHSMTINQIEFVQYDRETTAKDIVSMTLNFHGKGVSLA